MDKLRKKIRGLIKEGLCIAFSGGADSSLILKIAMEESLKQNLKNKVYAVTFDTKLHPKADAEIARKMAEDFGAIHIVIEVDELSNEKILENPVDRCYHCKKYLFQELTDFAKDKNLKYIADGTNYDDVFEYRPGLKALDELEIISPLKELGINKKQVREMLKKLNLQVAEKPSSPCMATRIPYNTKIQFSLLENIEKGEKILSELGFLVNRIRVHEEIARIEIKEEQFLLFIEKKETIIEQLKKLDFKYITLDLEGFRSGSMDLYLEENR